MPQPEGLSKDGTLPASVTLVYFTICHLADEGGGISTRRIMRKMGAKSPAHIQQCLIRLRAAGLVSYEGKASKNAGGAHAATIRPLYRCAMYGTKMETKKKGRKS